VVIFIFGLFLFLFPWKVEVEAYENGGTEGRRLIFGCEVTYSWRIYEEVRPESTQFNQRLYRSSLLLQQALHLVQYL
jgi:hypothetical protein